MELWGCCCSVEGSQGIVTKTGSKQSTERHRLSEFVLKNLRCPQQNMKDSLSTSRFLELVMESVFSHHPWKSYFSFLLWILSWFVRCLVSLRMILLNISCIPAEQTKSLPMLVGGLEDHEPSYRYLWEGAGAMLLCFQRFGSVRFQLLATVVAQAEQLFFGILGRKNSRKWQQYSSGWSDQIWLGWLSCFFCPYSVWENFENLKLSMLEGQHHGTTTLACSGSWKFGDPKLV